MPELPEVETVARTVHARVAGDRILDTWFSRHSEPFLTPPSRQAELLNGRRLLAVRRVGKHIVCDLAEARKDGRVSGQWVVHLGMTGRLLVSAPENPVAAHTHARLPLDSGRELRFVDPRRFGRLAVRNLAEEAPFAAAGLEPLTVAAREFADLFKGRRLAIKAALLNQSLLTGVGNIYADESLFHAGIRPTTEAGSLSVARLERLRLALREVLEASIARGGSSVSDYVDADGVRGFYQLEHCVYLRTGEACRKCQRPIERTLVGGRGTHYCPRCQR